MFIKMGYGVYLFFGALMLVSFFFVLFLLPETKAIPLEQMDRLFETKPVGKANRIVMEELHNLNEAQQQENETEKPAAVEYDA